MQKQLHDINCVFQGFDGVGGIYISGITGAKNISILQKYNIKAVVCAARSGYLQYDKTIIQDYLYIPADDYEQFNLSQYFQKTYDFIEKNRKKTNVLVHCMAGISRSVTLVVAYLIKKYGYSTNSILSLLKRKRSIINPNEGFLEQLKSFQNKHQSSQVKNETPRPIITHRQNYFSMNKTSQYVKNKSIEAMRKKTLSKQSKQFLSNLRKKQNNTIQKKSSKRTSSNVQHYEQANIRNIGTSIKFTKPQFYSSELGTNLNFVQVEQQVNKLEINLQLTASFNKKAFQEQIDMSPILKSLPQQINLKKEKLPETALKQILEKKQIKQQNAQQDKEQNKNRQEIGEKEQNWSNQQTALELQNLKQKPLSQKQIQLPLSERLQHLKANLLNQYKKIKSKNFNILSIQNDQQKQIDLTLATKLLKCKPRRYMDKKQKQSLNKFQIYN